MIYYTIYLEKTDEIVAFGTGEECARMLKKTMNNFRCLVSRSVSGENKKYLIVKENVPSDWEELSVI